MTTTATLHDALGSQFDRHAVRETLRVGDRNAVHEVVVDGRRAVCKVTTGNPATLAREAAVLSAVDRYAPVPVPEPLAAGEGYLVMAWAPGREPDPGQVVSRPRLRAVGRQLARLHDGTAGWFDGHGGPGLGGGLPGSERPTDWPTRLRGFLDDWAGDLDGTPHADVAAAVVECFAEHRDAFADRPPVLVHGEPAPEHVHFDGDEVAALVDWELAQAAPGGFDLAWAERDFLRVPGGPGVDPDRRAALVEGYESVRPPAHGDEFRRELYRAAFATRDLRYAVGDGGTGVADDPDRLRSYAFDRLDAAADSGPGHRTTSGTSRSGY